MAAPAAVYLGLVLMHSAAATFAALYIGVFTLISVLDLFVFEKSRKDILGEELGLRINPRALLMGLLSGLFFAAVVFFFFLFFAQACYGDT